MIALATGAAWLTKLRPYPELPKRRAFLFVRLLAAQMTCTEPAR